MVTFEIEKSGDQARAEEESYHEEEGKLKSLVNDQRDPELGVEIGERSQEGLEAQGEARLQERLLNENLL